MPSKASVRMPPSTVTAFPMMPLAEMLPILNFSSTPPTAFTTAAKPPNCCFASSTLPPRTMLRKPLSTSPMGLTSAPMAPTRIASTSVRLSAFPMLWSAQASTSPIREPMPSSRSVTGLRMSSTFSRIAKAVFTVTFTALNPMFSTLKNPLKTFCTFCAAASLSCIFPVSSSNPFKKLYSGLPSVMNTSPNAPRMGSSTLLMPSRMFRIPLKKCSRPESWFILPENSSRSTLPF